MTASREGAAPAELAAMQAAVVRAALRGTPLPGGAAAVALPDRTFLPASGPAPLAAVHLAPGAAAELGDLTRPAQDGDGAFLRFQPPQREADTLWLTLEIVLRDADDDPQPLGGVQVAFRRMPHGWQATDAPRAFAT